MIEPRPFFVPQTGASRCRHRRVASWQEAEMKSETKDKFCLREPKLVFDVIDDSGDSSLMNTGECLLFWDIQR